MKTPQLHYTTPLPSTKFFFLFHFPSCLLCLSPSASSLCPSASHVSLPPSPPSPPLNLWGWTPKMSPSQEWIPLDPPSTSLAARALTKQARHLAGQGHAQGEGAHLPLPLPLPMLQCMPQQVTWISAAATCVFQVPLSICLGQTSHDVSLHPLSCRALRPMLEPTRLALGPGLLSHKQNGLVPSWRGKWAVCRSNIQNYQAVYQGAGMVPER